MKIERNIEGKPLEAWRQHLLDAAAYIEQYGLHKGSCMGRSGSLCLIGALREARLGQDPFRCEAYSRLSDHLGCKWVPGWNDRPETTKEMAVNALIGAALSHTQ